MIRVNDLYFKYPRSEEYALEGVDLSIEEGKITAIMGENGSGKTTLLRLLAGFLEPEKGDVELDDKEIGFSPEDPELGFFAESVEKEIGFYPKNRGLDQKEMTERTMELLDIEHLKDELPHNLSSGEQRMVSIASVLSGDPDVVIMDEPTHSLHRKGEERIGEILKKVNKTIILSTHSSEFALEYADDLIVMHGGRVLAQGETSDIMKEKEVLERAGIRIPGIVEWAMERSIEQIPRSLDEALERGELG